MKEMFLVLTCVHIHNNTMSYNVLPFGTMITDGIWEVGEEGSSPPAASDLHTHTHTSL